MNPAKCTRDWLKGHPKTRFGLAVLALGWALSAFGLNPWYHPLYLFPEHPMKLSEEFVPHCMGRYVISLPKGFQLVDGFSDFKLIYGLDINWKYVEVQVMPGEYDVSLFRDAVLKKRSEWQNTINSEIKAPMLLHEEQLSSHAVLFRHLENNYSDAGLISEVHRLVENRYVILIQETFAPDEVIDRSFHSADATLAESNLKRISSLLKPANTETLKGDGFCYGDVIFDAGQDMERASFHFENPDAKSEEQLKFDIEYVSLETAAGLDNLFERGQDTPLAVRMKIDTLRKRELKLADVLPSRELLMRWHLSVPYHQFHLQSYTLTETTKDEPSLEVTMEAGRENQRKDISTPSPLSDAQAIALWDKVIQSIHHRHHPSNSGTQTMKINPVNVGEVCPQSGWWLASKTGDDVYARIVNSRDDRRQYFKEGQVMKGFFDGENDHGIVWTWIDV